MIHEATATGATVEEALSNARAALNAPALADVHTEIIAMPTKKLLGIFGGSPAKARAYYETPDVPEKKAPAKKAASTTAKKTTSTTTKKAASTTTKKTTAKKAEEKAEEPKTDAE